MNLHGARSPKPEALHRNMGVFTDACIFTKCHQIHLQPTPLTPAGHVLTHSGTRTTPSPQVHRHPMLAWRAVEGAHAAQHAHFGRKGAQPRLLVMGVRLLHINSSHSPGPRCGRICRARREVGAVTRALHRCWARRRARRVSAERAPRRGGGEVGEADEADDAGEAGEAGENG